MKKETAKAEKLSRKQRIIYAVNSFSGKKERIAGGTVYAIANKENAEIKEIKPGLYGSKKYCPYCGRLHFVKSKNPSELNLYDCDCGAMFTGEYVTKLIRTKR